MASSVLGQKCTDEWSPCSREGYCNSSADFCLWDLCNPSTSYNSTSCWQPEGCASRSVTFDSSADLVAIGNYGGNPDANPFLSIFEPNNAKAAGGNLELDMTYDAPNNKGFGATVKASHTIKYGKVTARMKSASVAPGVVTSFIIINEQTGDEIDFEWVGKAPTEVQTNYYYKKILDYTQMTAAQVSTDTSAAFHDYTIDWSADRIVWLVDNVAIRTLNRADTLNPATGVYAYPTSEARIGFSIWDGGNSGAQGTAEWSGYPTPWSPTTVYKALVDSITIECANDDAQPSDDNGGEEPTDGGEEPTDGGEEPTEGGEEPTEGGEVPPPKCRPRPAA
ncbi:putative glycosidase CRH2 [Coemansia sp. RSA 552]|nr:putative glycosidase CRH2 [Coemansia sp. RSA 552]